jgi:predicted transglutaminase-like cysteine proteinase
VLLPASSATIPRPFTGFQLASLTPFDSFQDDSDRRPLEPFGAELSAPATGSLQNKWAGVKNKLPRESKILERCRNNMRTCPPAAKRFLAVVDKAQNRDGWARIAEINRSINLNIRPVDDMAQYGVVDLWATPLMVFKSNAGDCEDYAIAKYFALHEIGFSYEDLRLVIMHLHGIDEDHAVAAVRYDGRWRILDNRTLDIRQDINVAGFDPLFVIDSEGVRRATTLATRPHNPWTDVRPAAVDSMLSPEPQSLPRLR